MLVGIYCYIDKKNDDIVYVGKDEYVFNKRKSDGFILSDKRITEHMMESKYDEQQINRVLQNNPERYYSKYLIVYNPETKPMNLGTLEKMYIAHFKPKFNFTDGDDGFGSGKNNPNYQRDYSTDERVEMAKRSDSDNSINVLNVHTYVDNRYNTIYYRYRRQEKNNIIQFSRNNLQALKEEVLRRGLEWIEY